MNNEKLLDKIIRKAEKNGFDNSSITCYDTWDIPTHLYVRFLLCEDFAKAFWGENMYHEKIRTCNGYEFELVCSWEYHLQQMVLEKDPLKYLEKFL